MAKNFTVCVKQEHVFYVVVRAESEAAIREKMTDEQLSEIANETPAETYDAEIVNVEPAKEGLKLDYTLE